MEKRMCWLALCWLLGGCLDNGGDVRKHDKSMIVTRIYRPATTATMTTRTTTANYNSFGGIIKIDQKLPQQQQQQSLSNGAIEDKFFFNNNNNNNNKRPVKFQAYDTKLDKVNIDHILSSRRLLIHYYNCLIGKGPCPPDGREIKRALPEALSDGCAKCTKRQREAAVKVIHHLRDHEPERFEVLANKYDPRGIYRKKYMEHPPVDTNSINDIPIDNDRRKRRTSNRP